MPDKQLFEYAILRIVPRVEREEFINAGVILYCKSQKFLQMLFVVDEQRVLTIYPEAELECIHDYINGFAAICTGKANASAISKLPLPERFRWLTAQRSTIIQTSKVHPGLCIDATEMLQRIFEEQVL